MLRRSLFTLAFAALSLAAAGCANEKTEAIEGLEQIKGACTAGDKDLARKLAEDLRVKNKIFDKAFAAATDDKGGTVDHCSPKLHNEVGLRIEHGN